MASDGITNLLNLKLGGKEQKRGNKKLQRAVGYSIRGWVEKKRQRECDSDI